MSEPTGIPVIDRLDALRARALEGHPDDANAFAHAAAAAYSIDLRAFVLRLQEERDRGLSHCLNLTRERDALLEALKASREKTRRALITSSISDGMQLRGEALDIMTEAITNVEGKE